jgi:hypothetical protein
LLGRLASTIECAATTPHWLREGSMTIRLGTDVRGRRATGAVATVAAAAAVVGLAVPAMAASAPPRAASAPPAARILSGGQGAGRSAVPWGKVGPGWALAFYSASQGGMGVKPKAGPSTLYLVDPQGGRYRLYTWSAKSPLATSDLVGWSGDVSRALFARAGGPGGREHVEQLELRTGRVTRFTLPARVSVVGYTRPDGLNIVASRQATTGNAATVQRYSLTGKLQKDLATVKSLTGGNFAYSANGTELAIGTVKGLDLISNAGGVIRKLHVPQATWGCSAVRWWSARTILASCSMANDPEPRMWLVPASGAKPTALTPVRSGGFDLGDFNAWQLSSGLYVNGYGGCAVLVIGRQPAHGKEQQVNVPGSASSLIVDATRSTLMVERINACMPGVSLVWFNPATRKMTVAIPVRGHQQGVTAVIPYFIAGKF